jgi:hypothetical protein
MWRYRLWLWRPGLGKERFINIQTAWLTLKPPSGQGAETWVNWIVGFIGGAKPWGRERVSHLWLSAITRWNRLTCLASRATGSSWVVLQAGETIRQGETSSCKSGSLVLRCSLGSFHPPKECQGPNNWERPRLYLWVAAKLMGFFLFNIIPLS